jgi:hypothetical protein
LNLNTCTFNIISFSGFSALKDFQFNFNNTTEVQKQEIINSDDYNQVDRYISLYDEIKQYFLDKNRDEHRTFFNNLISSEFNLIVSTRPEEDLGMNFS